MYLLYIAPVRVLSLSVIHGFVTEPWYSRHVLFSRERVASSALEQCTLSSACLVSRWSVVYGSRHSCLEFRFRVRVRTLALHVLSQCVSVRSRVSSAARSSVHVCFVVLHAVPVLIGCVPSCYVLCCVARSLCIHWLRAFMLSCLVCEHVAYEAKQKHKHMASKHVMSICLDPHPSCFLIIG